MLKYTDLSKIKNLPADTVGSLTKKADKDHNHDDSYVSSKKPITTLSEKWVYNYGTYRGEYGLDLKNSDIIGLNALFFNDETGDTPDEGIFFVRNGTIPMHLRKESDYNRFFCKDDYLKFNNDTIPTIGRDGVMEVGRYIDFHFNNEDKKDYNARIQVMDIADKTYLDFVTGRLSINGNRIVTDEDFSKYPDTNGWQKLSSGLIIQWGIATKSLNPGQDGQHYVDVTFPIVFPHAGICVVASPLNNKWDVGKIKWLCQTDEYNYYQHNNKYATFKVGVDTGGGATTINIKYIAIGY